MSEIPHAPGKRRRLRRLGSAAVAAGVTLGLAGIALPATAAAVAASELTVGIDQEFTGANGTMLQYHYFDNGDNGTLFYFDGDETTNFWYPEVPSGVVHEEGVGNGHVQRMREEAAERGMDLVFLNHPHGEDRKPGDSRKAGTSWWNYMEDAEVDRYAETVREIITATHSDAVQMVGYSGGSEFLVRHLLLDGNGWLPQNSAAAMIGGGGLAGYPLAAPSPGMEDMPYTWVVGLQDGPDVDDTSTWSALRVSRKAAATFTGLGYTQARTQEIPGVDHYDYDFRGIVGEQLDRLVANQETPAAEASATLSAGADGTFTARVENAGAGTAVTATFTQANTSREVTLGATDDDGAFTGAFPLDEQIVPGRYKVAVTAGAAASTTLTAELRRTVDENTRLYQTYEGSNGKELEYHWFRNGGKGALFYFDGDETTNFHHPLVPASVTHTNGFNGHIQRLNEEAKKRGVDLVFVEHPNEDQTWWEDWEDVSAAEIAVKEMIDEFGGDNVLLAGYSGGSEFLVSWMLAEGNGWGPQNTALVMIGGGTLDIEGELPAPAGGRENQAITWVVGANDGVGATYPEEWSAIGAATAAQKEFAERGYTGAALEVIPDTNHVQYDFRGIIAVKLDALLAQANQPGTEEPGTEEPGTGEPGSDDGDGAGSAQPGADNDADSGTGPAGSAKPHTGAQALARTGANSTPFLLLALGLLAAGGATLVGIRRRVR